MSAHLRQSVKFLLVNVKPIFLNVAKQFGAFTFWVGYQHNASFYVDDISVTNGITDIVPSEYCIDCVRYPDCFLLTPAEGQANEILCNFMLPMMGIDIAIPCNITWDGIYSFASGKSISKIT